MSGIFWFPKAKNPPPPAPPSPPLPPCMRLTDAEREAVARAVDALNGVEDWSPDVIAKDKQAAETIAAMLARLA